MDEDNNETPASLVGDVSRKELMRLLAGCVKVIAERVEAGTASDGEMRLLAELAVHVPDRI